MKKLTIDILVEQFGYSFVPGSHSIMSDGKGNIINVYGKPFIKDGKPIEFVEDLQPAQESYQEKLEKKTKKKDEN